MLAVGATAPDFTLPDQDGRPLSLAELLKDGPLLLYFYPADFTPVCTREACSFAALEPDLERTGVRLAGVSPQGGESHQRFRQRYGLKFTLLSDPERRVIRAYGCDGLLGLRVKRVTYLIGQDRRILERAHAAFRVGPHLALAQQASSGKP
ncbi:MAG TPA: peroxiredoxin [Gammaproteobacteria bacterium]|nr:peroxiredoxin [Gammaproteobacteria bacterium]